MTGQFWGQLLGKLYGLYLGPRATVDYSGLQVTIQLHGRGHRGVNMGFAGFSSGVSPVFPCTARVYSCSWGVINKHGLCRFFLWGLPSFSLQCQNIFNLIFFVLVLLINMVMQFNWAGYGQRFVLCLLRVQHGGRCKDGKCSLSGQFMGHWASC